MNKNNESKKPKKSDKPSDDQKKKAPGFSIWFYLIIILALLGFNFLVSGGDSAERIKYSEFLSYIEQGYVKEILITNNVKVEGEYTEKAIEDGIIEKPEVQENRWQSTGEPPVPKFTTTMLEGDEVRALFDEHGVVYDVRIEETGLAEFSSG